MKHKYFYNHVDEAFWTSNQNLPEGPVLTTHDTFAKIYEFPIRPTSSWIDVTQRKVKSTYEKI